MASREQMVAFIRNKASVAGQASGPSREEMISYVRNKASVAGQASGPSREEMISYVRNKASAQPDAQSVSQSESALRGAAQGATLGFADEISGGVEALWEKAKGDPKEFGELYKKFRDESRAKFKNAKEANPSTYIVGEVGGGLATLAIPGLGATNTVRGLAKAGAVAGGLAGLGASEADLTEGEFAEAAIDTAKGAAIGGAGGAILGGGARAVGKGVQKLGEKTKSLAERKAFESLGGLKKATDRASSTGRLNEIGRQALDEKVVTPLASKEKMLSRAEKLADDKLKAVMGLLDDASKGKNLNQTQKLALSKINLSPEEVGLGIKERIRAEYSDLPEEIIEGRLKEVDKWLSGQEPKTALEWQKFKTQAQKFIKDASYWKDNPSASQETMLAVRKGAKEAIEESVDDYASIVGDKTGQVKSMNRSLGNTLEMSDILSDRISRDTANQSFSLGDKVAAVGGTAAGAASGGTTGLVTGAATALGNKFLRHKGDQLAAVALDKVSKTLLRASPALQRLSKKSPKAFRAAISDASRRLSESGSPIKAASNERDIKLKGPNKWAVEGIAKLVDHGAKSITENEVALKKVLSSKRGRSLLISASSLKPGTKAMARILKQINELGGSD